MNRNQLMFVFFSLVAGTAGLVFAQGRYAAVTGDDVKSLQLNHYFTPDNKSHVPDFTWTFCANEFTIRKSVAAIPADLIAKLLPAGAVADEIKGKWRLDPNEAATLVLTDIKAGDQAGNNEVKLAIYRTAPTVIRIGEPQYVFGRRPNEALPPVMTKITFRSAYPTGGVPIGADGKLAYMVTLEAEVDAKGEGRGKLVLDMSVPEYDEFGDIINGREADNKTVRTRPTLPAQTFNCNIEFVKRGQIRRINTPSLDQSLFRITGPRVADGVTFVTAGPGLTSGKLIIAGKDGRNEFVVDLSKLEPARDHQRLMEPCHPGCFPSGTLVHTPSGTRAIECIHNGDVVNSVNAEGVIGTVVVNNVFCTSNKLIEVRTKDGSIITTGAQPFALSAGGFRKAEELVIGDHIWQWRNGKRVEATVRQVVATGRTDQVFNLVVGESVTFIAGEFVVRGKPPAVVAP